MGGFYYLAASHPEGTAERSTEDLAAETVDEWRHGVDGTGIRPGVIGEVGTYDPVQPEEPSWVVRCHMSVPSVSKAA